MQVAYTRTIMPSGLPPSPTLTNPDMILPYQSAPSNRWQPSSSSESSPETPQHTQQFPNFSPSSSNNESRPTRSEASETRRRLKPAGQSLSPFRNGVLSRPGGPTRARSVSEREKGGDGRIRYENSRLSYKPIGTPEKIGASSPTVKDQYSPNRVIIIEDDEQSEAAVESNYAPDNTYKTPSILEEDENNPNSHTAMSKRAEEILANAKKRLTNMEGNLHRARSTLGTRPSSSMSSFTNTRSNEPASLYSLSNHSVKHRQTGSLDDSKANHSRGFSDASNNDGSPKEEGLGISTGDGTDPGRPWFWSGLSRTTSLAQRERERHKALEPLHEDGPAPEKFYRQSPAIPEAQDEDPAADQGFDDLQKASGPFADFDSANPPAPGSGLTRARSTTQMRDIRDQMQDLKGKISTLKQRARQDSLYRRSLQNLRTPSPFTAAEQWYTGVPLHEERTASVSPQPNGTPKGESPARVSPEKSVEELANGHLEPEDGEKGDDDSGIDVHEQERPETAFLANSLPEEPLTERNDIPKVSIHDATASEKSLPELPSPDEEEAASLREVEDSLDGDEDQYHETSALPVGERHEDRPDAFDYEHFFLHSGMGHHKTGASRTSSRSSYSSVETTKPADSDTDAAGPDTSTPHLKHTHARKESVDSTTSFTTAPSSERSPTDDDERETPTPKNVVIAPVRSDSLRHLKANRANNTHNLQPQVSHRDRPSKASIKKGTRPPSNSLSSSHLTIIAQQQQQQQQAANGTTTATSTHSSPLLGYLSTLSPKSNPNAPHSSPSSPKTHPTITLSSRDTLLTERLFQSLARVCADLETLTSSAEDAAGEGEEEAAGGKYKARMYRRKLDAARRVLDGEVNGELF